MAGLWPLTFADVLLWLGAWSLVGFVGIILGARAFHHKTSKPSFWPPVGGAVVLWTAALVLAFQHGLLSF